MDRLTTCARVRVEECEVQSEENRSHRIRIRVKELSMWGQVCGVRVRVEVQGLERSAGSAGSGDNRLEDRGNV